MAGDPDSGEMVCLGPTQAQSVAADTGYHWFHAERSSGAAIAQFLAGEWHLIGEKESVSLVELRRRGWEYLGPVTGRPYSRHLDY